MEYTQAEQFLIWLCSVEGVGAKRVEALLERYGGAQVVWEDLGEHMRPILGDAPYAALRAARDPKYFAALFEEMQAHGAFALTRDDACFPPLLREIHDPPYVLFARGQRDCADARAFAIVGSRGCTPYGGRMAYRFGRALTEMGVTIVSGLARGVDGRAHRGAVDAKGRTVAILGSGVDVIYPKENAALAGDILENGGTLLSEYRPGSPPRATHFPARNRLISGICAGMLLVEAAERSGAMITVDFALEQGREVFALPGQADNPRSMMPHRIIREGARLAGSPEDILSDMGWGDFLPNSLSQTAPEALSGTEKRIWEALSGGAMRVDALIEAVGEDAAKINSHLTSLALRGIIRQSPGAVVERM